MDPQTFNDSINQLRTAILDLLEVVDGYSNKQSTNPGWVLEAVKTQNRHWLNAANEQVTLYNSLRNAEVLKHFTLEHKDSSLVKCEQKIRAEVVSGVRSLLTQFAEKCIQENEPETRLHFMKVVSVFNTSYDVAIAKGDYMMYLPTWFEERIPELVYELENPTCGLKDRYLSLANLLNVIQYYMKDPEE